MDSQEYIKKINLADRSVRVISKDGLFRAVAVKNSASARTAQLNHGYPSKFALSLAREMSFASLLSAFLKGEERIIVQIDSENTHLQRLYSEAMPIGEIRAFGICNKDVDDCNLSGSILRVSRILYGKTEPVFGIIQAKSSELDDIFDEYMEQSEQIPSIVRTDAEVDSDGVVIESGGIIVQAMPGASEADIRQVFDSVRNMKNFSEYLFMEMRPDQILKLILPFSFDVLKSSRVDFFCRCSKEQFIYKLKLLGLKEIMQMKDGEQNELVCQFCNKHYRIEPEDFDKIIKELEAKSN